MAHKTPSNVEEYIAKWPAKTQALLKELRKVILQTAPEAEECITYRMPSYKLDGMLVHFGGYKTHIGFYPGNSAIAAFQLQLSGYNYALGSVQFPLDQAIPVPLVQKMVKFRIKENKAIASKKKKG